MAGVPDTRVPEEVTRLRSMSMMDKNRGRMTVVRLTLRGVEYSQLICIAGLLSHITRLSGERSPFSTHRPQWRECRPRNAQAHTSLAGMVPGHRSAPKGRLAANESGDNRWADNERPARIPVVTLGEPSVRTACCSGRLGKMVTTRARAEATALITAEPRMRAPGQKGRWLSRNSQSRDEPGNPGAASGCEHLIKGGDKGPHQVSDLLVVSSFLTHLSGEIRQKQSTRRKQG